MIILIVTYRGEISGFQTIQAGGVCSSKVFKEGIGIAVHAINMAALRECGRYLIFITSFVKCIKYWLKWVSLPEDWYIKSCYKMLKDLDSEGKK